MRYSRASSIRGAHLHREGIAHPLEVRGGAPDRAVQRDDHGRRNAGPPPGCAASPGYRLREAAGAGQPAVLRGEVHDADRRTLGVVEERRRPDATGDLARSLSAVGRSLGCSPRSAGA